MALPRFYNKENAFDTFVRLQGFKQCVWVSNTKCKYKAVCKKMPHGAFRYVPNLKH